MGNDPQYVSNAHCVCLIQYHVIWCPKFRYSVLKGDVEAALKRILADICSEYGYRLLALEVMPDHVHIFVSAPHTAAPCDVARTLKSLSAVRLFVAFPSLKRFYAKSGRLWSRGYFISTIGQISAETVRKYIAAQKAKV